MKILKICLAVSHVCQCHQIALYVIFATPPLLGSKVLTLSGHCDSERSVVTGSVFPGTALECFELVPSKWIICIDLVLTFIDHRKERITGALPTKKHDSS